MGTTARTVKLVATATATATGHDATERRTTELFARAVDQLGSDKAAVRHGGLCAPHRLARDSAQYRQTAVNVLCAYLRVPYAPQPAAGGLRVARARRPASPGPRVTANRADDHRRQEREVRIAAQRILTDHLRRHAASEAFRPDIVTARAPDFTDTVFTAGVPDAVSRFVLDGG